MLSNGSGYWPALTMSLAIVVSAGASAQERRAIEEVVVTATYRETGLMDTPQAISALTGDTIKDLGAQDIGDVFRFIPGLNMAGTNTGSNRFTVRGISSQTGNISYALASSTIGVYLDGTPVTSAFGPGNQLVGNLFDIERVEVLKGPQGTLFGEGSQGGTIRYLYNKPDPTGFDYGFNVSGANVEGSSDHSHRVDGMVNIPVSDRMAVRLMAFQSRAAGFIDNLTPYEKDFNPREAVGGRISSLFEGDRYSIEASVYYANQETKGGSATVRPYEAEYARFPGKPPFSDSENAVYNLTVDYDFGWGTLTSSSSYLDREDNSVTEASYATAQSLDLFYAPIFNLGNPGTVIEDGNNLQAFNSYLTKTVERYVQEFRLVSPGDGSLRWTAGLFFKDSTDGFLGTSEAATTPGREAFGDRFNPLLRSPANSHTDTIREYAAFGEVSYDITDNWEITAGLRISKLKQEFENTDTGTSDTPISPKLVVSWRPTGDFLAYASYTTGFRPGNVNNHMEFAVETFESQRDIALSNGLLEDAASAQEQADLAAGYRFFDGDWLSSYELGIKASFYDRRLLFTGAVYFLDWKDMIQNQSDSRMLNLNFYNINAGSAHSQGVEIEVTALLTDRLSVRLAGDYNQSELDDDPDYSGQDLLYAPSYSFSAALDYEISLSDRYLLNLHINQSWVDDQVSSAARRQNRVPSRETAIIPGYHSTNARVTLRSSTSDRWRVAIFANNLTNEEILRDTTVDGDFFWEMPRSVGVEFGWTK